VTSEPTGRDRYVRAVLDLYRTVPGVLGRVRRADRDLADRLFHNGVPFYAIRHAFIVAAARRIRNNAFATPLPPVRSLHYFLPVLREVIERPPGYREIEDMLQVLSRECTPL
jgi:hypothetical protein